MRGNVKAAAGYNKLLGVESFELDRIKDVRGQYADYVKANFSGVRDTVKQANPFSYVKNTVVSENIRFFAEPMSQGRLFTSAARVGFFGFTLADIFNKTKKDAQQGKSTVLSLAEHCFKSLVAWEAGSIGMVVTRALFPVVGWSYIAGTIGLAVFSAIAHKLLYWNRP